MVTNKSKLTVPKPCSVLLNLLYAGMILPRCICCNQILMAQISEVLVTENQCRICIGQLNYLYTADDDAGHTLTNLFLNTTISFQRI